MFRNSKSLSIFRLELLSIFVDLFSTWTRVHWGLDRKNLECSFVAKRYFMSKNHFNNGTLRLFWLVRLSKQELKLQNNRKLFYSSYILDWGTGRRKRAVNVFRKMNSNIAIYRKPGAIFDILGQSFLSTTSSSSSFSERFVYSLAKKLGYHSWKDYLKQKYIVLNENEVFFIRLTFFGRMFFQDFHMKNESKIFLGSLKKSFERKKNTLSNITKFSWKPFLFYSVALFGKMYKVSEIT